MVVESGQATMKTGSDGRGIRKKVVLLVDDEATIRRLLINLCRQIGSVECVEAGNVTDALAILKKKHVDLIISDLSMPDENGLKIVQTVRSKLFQHRIPVIIFSGSLSNEDEMIRLKQAGVDLLLEKVADLAEIKNAIVRFINV